MAKLARGGGKKTMIALTIKDKVALRNDYMPFIINGGLFMPNRADYDRADYDLADYDLADYDLADYVLGDEVFILLNLMDQPEKIPIAGKVVWVARKGVKSPHTPGVGIQFSDPDNIAKDKIETYLAGSLGSANATATM